MHYIRHLVLRIRVHLETRGRMRLGNRIVRPPDPELERQTWRRPSIG
jgi:hypothetical protein